MTLEQALVQVGINVASDVVTRVGASIYNTFKTSKNPTEESLKKSIANALNIERADIFAEKLIQFLAKNGSISIDGATVHSNTAIEMFSSPGQSLTFGNGSVSSTAKTRVEAGKGAYIKASGNAGMIQNEDGSIGFFT